MTAEVIAGYTAQAVRRLQGVLETRGDVKPIKDESRIRHDPTLQLPQSGIAIAQHRRRRAETDARTHNRVRKFAHRIAVAGKGEAMRRSIEIEHLTRDHFGIACRATMPAAQLASIEANHNGSNHNVNVGVCVIPRDPAAICSPTRRVRLRIWVGRGNAEKA